MEKGGDVREIMYCNLEKHRGSMFHSSLPWAGPYKKTWHRKKLCLRPKVATPPCLHHTCLQSQNRFPSNDACTKSFEISWWHHAIQSEWLDIVQKVDSKSLLKERFASKVDNRSSRNESKLLWSCVVAFLFGASSFWSTGTHHAPTFFQICFEHVEKNNDLSSTKSTCSRL